MKTIGKIQVERLPLGGVDTLAEWYSCKKLSEEDWNEAAEYGLVTLLVQHAMHKGQNDKDAVLDVLQSIVDEAESYIMDILADLKNLEEKG